MNYSRLGLVIQEQSYRGLRHVLKPKVRPQDIDIPRIQREFALVGFPLQTFPLEGIGAYEDQVTRATVSGFRLDGQKIIADEQTMRRMSLLIGLPIYDNASPSLIANSMMSLLNDPKFSGGTRTTIEVIQPKCVVAPCPASFRIYPMKNFLDAWDRSAIADRLIEQKSEAPLKTSAAVAAFWGWHSVRAFRTITGATLDQQKLDRLAELVKNKIGNNVLVEAPPGATFTVLGQEAGERNTRFVFGSNRYRELLKTLHVGTLDKSEIGGLTASQAAMVALGLIVEEGVNFPIVSTMQTNPLVGNIHEMYTLIAEIDASRRGIGAPNRDVIDEVSKQNIAIGVGIGATVLGLAWLLSRRARQSAMSEFAILSRAHRSRRRKRRR